MRCVILGCGYTGSRVAALLLRRGIQVSGTTRNPAALADLEHAGCGVIRFDALQDEVPDLGGAVVLHSIPVVEATDGPREVTNELLRQSSREPKRIVYLSTTGVYGTTEAVDETTPANPVREHDRLRVAAETAVAAGPWSSLVLRPAAIYGPGRGVHVGMQRGTYRMAGEGKNYVSRIHVDDLARIAEAALLSDLSGSYPVADDRPCQSGEIAAFCAELLKIPVPPAGKTEDLHRTRTANRRVDGSAIRRALGLDLLYPSYREGIPASLT